MGLSILAFLSFHRIGTVDATWMTQHGDPANLPPTLRSPPVLIYQNTTDSAAANPSSGARLSVLQALQQESPLLYPGLQWEVYKHGRGAVLNAKLLLLKFCPKGDTSGFLRVCIGSANLYSQWQHARGAQ